MYMFTHIILKIIHKTLFYKFIITKISYKSLLKFLLFDINYRLVFDLNLLYIFLFIVKILQKF